MSTPGGQDWGWADPSRSVTGPRPSNARPPVVPEDREVILDRAVWRMSVLKVVLLLGLACLGLRAGVLMLLPNERLQAKATIQFQHAVTVEAPRGEILARDGEILATTVEMPSLHADPSLLDPAAVDDLAAELAKILQKDESRILRQLRRSSRQDVTLARQLSPEKLEEVRGLAPRGVLWSRSVATRYYPGREFASQLLGVVGHQGRGLEGVELALDSYLRGDTFMYIQERDRRGRAISTAPGIRQMAKPGDTVQLTLHRGVQQAAELALADLVVRSEPVSASAVVIDVQTGEILAIANRPTSNPNDSMNRDVKAFKNHALVDAHEPGSVLKPFVVALALKHGLVGKHTLVDCENGLWYVGRVAIHDDHKHKVVPLSDVIKFSSNIGAAKQALALGAEFTIEGLKDFGFAAQTGIQVPTEVSGRLREPDRILPIELATTSYGQGMTATTIQLASAYAVLANGGMRMQPYLVAEIRDHAGHLQLQNGPRQLGQVVSKDVAQTVVDMMETVLEDGGTGTAARIPGYSAAGKTGTAHKVVDGVYSQTERVASFVGLVPADNPRIAIAVVVDSPQKKSRYGGTVAGPAFSMIGAQAMRVLGVPEDRPETSAREMTEARPLTTGQAELPPELIWSEEALVVPDVQGLAMRDVLALVDGSGLQVSLEGIGVAFAQAPEPGARLVAGERLEVRFR
jgi:cell division protein FtsI (penicillin-binding protein 3)